MWLTRGSVERCRSSSRCGLRVNPIHLIRYFKLSSNEPGRKENLVQRPFTLGRPSSRSCIVLGHYSFVMLEWCRADGGLVQILMFTANAPQSRRHIHSLHQFTPYWGIYQRHKRRHKRCGELVMMNPWWTNVPKYESAIDPVEEPKVMFCVFWFQLTDSVVDERDED